MLDNLTYLFQFTVYFSDLKKNRSFFWVSYEKKRNDIKNLQKTLRERDNVQVSSEWEFLVFCAISAIVNCINFSPVL